MTAIPPGWYPDQNGVTRWWDGTQWTAATQPVSAQPEPPAEPAAPAQPGSAQPAQPGSVQPGYSQPGYAQPGYVQPGYAQPAAYAQAAQYPQVAPGTSATTVWAWLVALLPVVDLLLSIGYMMSLPASMHGAMSGLGGIDPSTPEGAAQLSSLMIGAFLNGWYVAVVVFGILVYALGVVFAALDHRDLRRRGFVKPFHWAWAFLVPPVVYIIGRTVVINRRGGRSLGPLWAMIAVWLASFVVSWVLSAAIGVQVAQFMTDFMGQYGYTN